MTAAVRALAVAVVLAATALTFRPVLDHGLLNWDDPRVVGHPRLKFRGVARARAERRRQNHRAFGQVTLPIAQVQGGCG